MQKMNFPRLFIYEGEPGRETVSRMQSTEVDLELETRVTNFYMEYWALSLSMEGRAEWQGEFCELGASRLTEERVVLHGDHLLRMKGEMVHEFKCEWVVVTAQTGYKAEGERCLDHLPVFTVQQELSYLAPITWVLTLGSRVHPELQRQLSSDGRGQGGEDGHRQPGRHPGGGGLERVP